MQAPYCRSFRWYLLQPSHPSSTLSFRQAVLQTNRFRHAVLQDTVHRVSRPAGKPYFRNSTLSQSVLLQFVLNSFCLWTGSKDNSWDSTSSLLNTQRYILYTGRLLTVQVALCTLCSTPSRWNLLGPGVQPALHTSFIHFGLHSIRLSFISPFIQFVLLSSPSFIQSVLPSIRPSFNSSSFIQFIVLHSIHPPFNPAFILSVFHSTRPSFKSILIQFVLHSIFPSFNPSYSQSASQITVFQTSKHSQKSSLRLDFLRTYRHIRTSHFPDKPVLKTRLPSAQA